MTSRGFTLVELMVVIAVLAIFSTLAMPSFSQLIAQVRVRSAAGDVYSALVMLRSEAMKRNAPFSLEAVDASNWSKGWRLVTAGGTELLSQGAFVDSVMVAGPANGKVTYQWNGRPDTATLAATQPLLKVSSATYPLSTAYCFSLSLSGMAEKKAC